MKNSNASGGIGFLGLLTIAFIVLKLTRVIHWSWLWVLSPLWIPLAILAIICIVVGVATYVNTEKEVKKRDGL